MSTCSNCGIAITVSTSYCPQCGAQLEAMPPPQPQTTPPPQQGYGADPYAQQNPHVAPGGYGSPAYGSPYATQGEPPNTGTAMAIAVITFLFCCWPMGVAGFIFVSQAKTAIVNDDYEAARGKIKLTYILCGVGAAGSLLMYMLLIVFFILAETM